MWEGRAFKPPVLPLVGGPQSELEHERRLHARVHEPAPLLGTADNPTGPVRELDQQRDVAQVRVLAVRPGGVYGAGAAGELGGPDEHAEPEYEGEHEGELGVDGPWVVEAEAGVAVGVVCESAELSAEVLVMGALSRSSSPRCCYDLEMTLVMMRCDFVCPGLRLDALCISIDWRIHERQVPCSWWLAQQSVADFKPFARLWLLLYYCMTGLSMLSPYVYVPSCLALLLASR